MTRAASPRVGRRPGPKPRLSRDKIVAAAIEVGIDQVSMGAIASALGTSTAGLYRYFDSRDEIVAAALQKLLAAMPLPPSDGGWRSLLEAEAATRWSLLTRYSGLINDHAASLRSTATHRIERLARELVGCGFTLDDAVLAVDSVLDLVHDAAAQAGRLRDPHDPARLSDEMAATLELYSDDVRGAVEAIVADPRSHLDRKLGIVLDGIEHRLGLSGRTV